MNYFIKEVQILLTVFLILVALVWAYRSGYSEGSQYANQRYEDGKLYTLESAYQLIKKRGGAND